MGQLMDYTLIEAELIVACEEFKIRIEQLNNLLTEGTAT